jgi:uncharacterized protein YlzI (FlbEa/FlbD family)
MRLVKFTLANAGLTVYINPLNITALTGGNAQTTIYVVGGQNFTVLESAEQVQQQLLAIDTQTENLRPLRAHG